MTVPLVDAVQDLDLSPESTSERYRGFDLRPFENVPDPRFYVPSAMHETAKQRILCGIHTRKGIVMFTREIGSGKTLLSRSLIRNRSRSRYEVGLVSNPSMPRNELLGEIMFHLWVEPIETKAGQLHRLNDQLLANYHRGGTSCWKVPCPAGR